jgi:hypothetical protein
MTMTWRDTDAAKDAAESRERTAIRCLRTYADALRESVACGGSVSARTHERLDVARARLARMGAQVDGL